MRLSLVNALPALFLLHACLSARDTHASPAQLTESKVPSQHLSQPHAVDTYDYDDSPHLEDLQRAVSSVLGFSDGADGYSQPRPPAPQVAEEAGYGKLEHMHAPPSPAVKPSPPAQPTTVQVPRQENPLRFDRSSPWHNLADQARSNRPEPGAFMASVQSFVFQSGGEAPADHVAAAPTALRARLAGQPEGLLDEAQARMHAMAGQQASKRRELVGNSYWCGS